MANPNLLDPFGKQADPASIAGALERVVDERIKLHLTGRSSQQFNGVADLALVHELIARGWAVFRPRSSEG